MALSMAEIRAKMKQQEEAATAGTSGAVNTEPNAFLAHWNIALGAPLNLRFLPDGNSANEFFWKERDLINLSFNGIKGGDSKPTRVTVPCNEMWGATNSCPVLKEVREWYKSNDESVRAMASKYWKKKSYLLQVFVAPGSTTVDNDVAPENPIRRVILNKDLFTKVKSIIMNPKIEHLPVDYIHGRDFSITKSKKGEFFDYDGQWDFAERELSQLELEAIEKYGLFDLSEFMPKQPTTEELNAIEEMFNASVNGEAYDTARWGKFYRPAGVQYTRDDTTATSTVQAPVPVSAPVQTPSQSTTLSPQELLARLQASRNQAAQ
jgi:hypothetical protein